MFVRSLLVFLVVCTMSIRTNSKLNRNTKRATQGPHWHFNCCLIHLTWLSILFHSARHVQFYDSNDCWQFLNSSFFSFRLELCSSQLSFFEIHFIMLPLVRFFVSEKCSACEVAMNDPLVISDSCRCFPLLTRIRFPLASAILEEKERILC